jgi:hypothetical protein
MNVLVSSSTFGNQWYFNGTLIPGANDQQYIPKQSGNYSAAVIQGSCSSDTSYSIKFIEENLGVVLYPNPCHDYLYIYKTQNRVLTYDIMNVYGKLINSGPINNNNSRIYTNDLPTGEYFICIIDKKNNVKTTMKFIKI